MNLKKLISKQYQALINDIIENFDPDMFIEDQDGNLLLGEAKSGDKYPIQLGSETLGWVGGSSKATKILASWLANLADVELERKNLANEVLSKYKEINLLSSLSNKLSTSLELAVILQRVLDEVQNLVSASSASVMMLNGNKDCLEVIAAFGTALTLGTKIPVKMGEGIAGSILANNKAELINNVASDSRFIHGEHDCYALICVPLKARDEVTGILSVSNTDEVDYKAADLQLISILASEAGNAIENAILHKTEIKSAVARSEIEKGQQMQKNFLPPIPLQRDKWQIAAKFLPARQVAGDFYDTFELPYGCIGLVIADVCDKGVGSALFMALFRSLIRVFAVQCCSRRSITNLTDSGDLLLFGSGLSATKNPATMVQFNALEAISLTNNYVAETHGELGMFATTFFGVLDPESGLLAYINGGHEPLIIMNSSGIKQRIKPTGPAVGVMENMKFKIGQVYLEPGDLLVGYTDGVPEARNPNRDFFTEEKLLSLVEGHYSHPQPLLDLIESHLITHIADADQFDDITMLAVYREPSPSN